MSSLADGSKSAIVTRIADELGAPVRRLGRDWILPGGQLLVVTFAKPQHNGRDFFVGIPNRLANSDALIVVLGDSAVVFENASTLLAYASHMSHSSDGRPNPRFRNTSAGLILSVSSLALEVPMADRIDRFDRLDSDRPQAVSVARREIGRPFRPGDETKTARLRASPDPDLSVQDRATQGHTRTLNLLGEFLSERGIRPREAETGEPQYDLAWVRGHELFVAEVKSLTGRNERQQLRLGLGQVLQYRHQMGQLEHRTTAVLAVEHQPGDLAWLPLCHDLDVLLVWPRAFGALG